MQAEALKADAFKCRWRSGSVRLLRVHVLDQSNRLRLRPKRSSRITQPTADSV
jgi:hypothetical protein